MAVFDVLRIAIIDANVTEWGNLFKINQHDLILVALTAPLGSITVSISLSSTF